MWPSVSPCEEPRSSSVPRRGASWGMICRPLRGITRTVGVLVAIAMAGSTLLNANAAPSLRTLLAQRDVTPGLAQAVRLRPANPNRILDLTVSLALRNQPALDRFIADVSDPISRSYGRYLRPAEFATLYGPSPAQDRRVVDHLRRNGLAVTAVSPNRALVHASGPVRAVNAAFGIAIWDWHDREQNRDFFGNDSQPVLPASLATLVVGIAGLNNHYQARHIGSPRNPPGGGPVGGYTPTNLKSAYDVTPLAARRYAGAGQALGLFELDGFRPANIATYDAQYGLLTHPITVVSVDGGAARGAGEIEVELDIEVMHAIAPQATNTVWEGPNTDWGALDTYAAMVDSDSTTSNSTSWGLCEPDTTPSLMTQLDNVFKQAAAQGQSFFAASGDSGAYDCANSPSGGSIRTVDHPASDPYMTGVGGTTLNLDVNGAYASETVWSNPSHAPPLGGGGGVSQVFGRPAWQTGPGVFSQYSNGHRQVPDVALDADPQTGYSVYITNNNTTGWAVVAGTSGGAPAWAAITAILNEYRFDAGADQPRLGFVNPLLYRLGSTPPAYPPFHDVTSGDNLYYSATVGWDLATGWGSVDVFNLARDLVTTPLRLSSGSSGRATRRVPPPPLPHSTGASTLR